jgi:hypothetical protein
MDKQRVFTELQKPELMAWVPMEYLLLVVPIPTSLIFLLGMFFWPTYAFLTAIPIALIIWLVGLVWTRVDPEFMKTFLTIMLSPKPLNWPFRSGKHYQG